MQISNANLAYTLFRLANLMEISGEPGAKVQAYRTAAQQILEYPEKLANLTLTGRALTTIKGVGESIASQLQAMLTDGHMPRYEELKAEVPEGLIELLSIRGLGAAKVRTLHTALGIAGIDDLREALEAGRLREAKGFTPRTEDRIRRSLYEFSAHRGRTLRALVEPTAMALVELLEALPGVTRAVPAGSYRRGLETVGTLDMVVASDSREEVHRALVAWDFFFGWSDGQPDTMAFLTDSDLHVAVHLVPPGAFGTELHRRTGSAEYLAALTEGLDVLEEPLAESEEQYCAALAIPCLPPELRSGVESLNEVRISGMPELIVVGDIRGDLHMHTTHTDGRNTVEEMARFCRERGLEYLAITDHTRNVRVAGGLFPEEIPGYLEAIELANQRVPGITILKGLEVDILADGSMDMPDEIMAQLDVVIGAIHSHFDQDSEAVTRRVLTAMEHPLVQFIAHPSGRLVGSRSPLLLDFDRLYSVAERTGTMFELNANPERLDLHDQHCRRARQLNIPVVINTDAHAVQQLDNLGKGISQARRGMLAATDVLNTRPLPAMLELLQRKRNQQ